MQAWISDIDGVLVDLNGQPNAEAIELSAHIGAGDASFSYVTGREAHWLVEHFLPLLSRAYRRYPPRLGLVCAEYGGVILRFDLESGWSKQLNPAFAPLDRRRAQVRSLVSQIQGVVQHDHKEVIITVGVDHSRRHIDTQVVADGMKRAEAIFKGLAAGDHSLEFGRTTNACDLLPVGLNKAYGASLVLDYLEREGLFPDQVCLLGDSPSDLGLSQGPAVAGLPYVMYFVGDQAKLDPADLHRPHLQMSRHRYDRAAVEILLAALSHDRENLKSSLKKKSDGFVQSLQKRGTTMKVVRGAALRYWEKVGTPTMASELLGRNFYGLNIGIQQWKNPKTGEVEDHTYFVKHDGFTVCPVTATGTLVMVRQFKQAAGGMVTEFPAGVLKKDEELLTAAGRELAEETGYVPEAVAQTAIQRILLAPRKSPSGYYTFAATGCRLAGEQQLDEGEAGIEIVEVDTEEMWQLVAEGEVRATETVTAAFLAAIGGYIPFPASPIRVGAVQQYLAEST
ncbi:MAG TPA: NUDIX hydrolase [Candidatus Saccharimonadales bacterium]|nr:NUDIX hydrolase [Candidatus Saccharimonadales bacterium]